MAWRALHLDHASVRMRELQRDRQAKAETVAVQRRARAAIELLENPPMVVLADADAAVDDFDDRLDESRARERRCA